MLRASPARYVRGLCDLRRRSILELLACIRGGARTRIAIAVGLLACFGLEGLSASTRALPPGLTVHRSTRAVPRKFTVSPNGATVAANQTQRFEVSDAQGKPVAVRWNVSGIGCSGMGCGSIDDQGVYRTPSSIPQPRLVILEAVLVADPNYSVLTQVRLENAATVAVGTNSAPVSIGEMPQFTAPVLGRQNIPRSAEVPPLPSVVAAAPVLGRQNLARSAEVPPLPSVIAAAPVLGRQRVRSAELPSLPLVVAAAPVLGKQKLVRSVELPLASVVSAAPVLGKQKLGRDAELPALPSVVPAAPVLGKQNLARSVELPALPSVVAAVSPNSFPISTGKMQQFTATVAGKQNVLQGSMLQPLADERDATRGAAVVSSDRSTVVTYREGQLTIDAGNSTLAEVLKLVAEKTGAAIDVPPGTGLERIVEHTGPGRADDVVAALLNGSPYDFIIVGSPQRPHELMQVLLSLRRADMTPSSPPLLPKQASSASLWTPPEPAPLGPVVATDLDNFEPPKEPLSPEVLGQMMKERAQQLRQRLPPSQ